MPKNAQKDSDYMSFLSFNSALPVLESLKRKRKTLYIQSVVEEARPQLCWLPEQIPDLTIKGYRTSLCQSGEGPVLLYDINRVVLTQFHTDDNDQYTAIDYSDFVVAGVSVLSNTIPSHVGRKFSLVTWRGALFAEPIAVAVHKLVSYLHRLTYATGEPVLSVGSIPANASVEIRKAVTTECQLHDESFLQNIQPDMSDAGFLPSMTESVMKPVRDLYRLSVSHCNTSQSNISECFIGSRKLPMLQAKAFDVSQTVVNSRCFQAGKSTSSKMAADLIQRCLPTMTSVITQSPPPAHHGG